MFCEDNKSIKLSAVRPHADEIYDFYKGRPISENDIKKDAEIFLLGIRTGRARVAEVGGYRKNTRSLLKLLKAIDMAKNH